MYWSGSSPHLFFTRDTAETFLRGQYMSNSKRIALLIDCDNASHNSIKGVLDELAKHGMVNIRHAHGDWDSPNLSGWKDKLHENAIRPMQQFAYTKGKNATDSAMIIDSMDILYSDTVDAFALMTSDSDFTPLVLRILESGRQVFGFGERKTPDAFIKACAPFIFTENLVDTHSENEEKQEEKEFLKADRKKLRGDTALVCLLRDAVEQTSEDDGWAHMSQVGAYISNNSSFSSINYGYKKLGDLIRTSDLFDIEMRGDRSVMVIRDKKKRS